MRLARSRERLAINRRLKENLDVLRETLGVGVTYDVIERRLLVAGRQAALIFVDGFVKDKVTLDIIAALQRAQRPDLAPKAIESLLAATLPYFEVDTVDTLDDVVDQVLSGPMAVLIDGERSAIIVDVREYPVRGIDEPDLERVTRGSHEGFVETMIFNTAMIRRRLRDPQLRFEVVQVGARSKTDVAIGYIRDIADPDLVGEVKRRIEEASVDALPMGAKNLEEIIVRRPWNPIPRVRYTERPDVAAAHLLEGHVAILVDTTPMAMIAPVTVFHFFQHAEEFFQLPFVGTYLRWIRAVAFGLATFLAPLWLALYLTDAGNLPEFLSFIGPKEEAAAVAVPLQFFLLEVGIDLLRMALIHTPSALATSLGIVGAILLGELAVEVGLFIPEAILYSAVAAIGYFAVPSIEFGYALRIYRYALLILVVAMKIPGLLIGFVIGVALLATTKSINTPYLWPLIPFDGPNLVKALFRLPVPVVGRRPAAFAGEDADASRMQPAPGRARRKAARPRSSTARPD